MKFFGLAQMVIIFENYLNFLKMISECARDNSLAYVSRRISKCSNSKTICTAYQCVNYTKLINAKQQFAISSSIGNFLFFFYR